MADKGTPSWPKITIRLYDAHNGEVKIAGRSHPLVAADPREAAIGIIAERAGQLGRPVRATAVEADGTSYPLIIHPDGQVDALDANAQQSKPIWPILVAAGVALALVTATVLYLAVFRDKKPVAAPTGPPTLPTLPTPNIHPDVFDARPFPPGFSTTATWTIDLADGTDPAVAADESKVAVITTDQKIAMLDGSGRVLWQDQVPEDAETPVFTTIDSKPVVAVIADDVMLYWPVDGSVEKATKSELGSGNKVQFFGPSPMLTTEEGWSYVLDSGKWVQVTVDVRRATVLYADGKRVLAAGYYGPLFWAEPGGEQAKQVPLTKPDGATAIDHVVEASPGKVVALWKTKNEDVRIAAIHKADNGSLLATCPPTTSTSTGAWVPDQTGKVAALGSCVIDFAKAKTKTVTGFSPLSVQRTAIWGNGRDGLTLVTPTGKDQVIADGTARPWGIVSGHAIIVHENVLYALAQPKGTR